MLAGSVDAQAAAPGGSCTRCPTSRLMD